MLSMNARVSLSNPSASYFDEVEVMGIEDQNHFSYRDNEGSKCEMFISDGGLCLFKQAEDHELELHLLDNNYAKSSTVSRHRILSIAFFIPHLGYTNIDAKVVAYSINSDILVMRYLISDEERTIRIQYY